MSRADVAPWYRLGYISPHPTVDTLAYEIYRMAPAGLMLVTTGLRIEDYTVDAVEAQLQEFRVAVQLLADRRVDRIVLSGVPIAAALGRSRMQELLAEASGSAGVPVDTDLEAISRGALHLGVRRVSLATRWKASVNEAVVSYLGEAGIDVVDVVNMPRTMAQNAELDDASGMALALDLGRRALASEAAPDGAIMPGGRWIAIQALEPLEAEFGRPMFLNFASSLWAALHDHGYREPIRGWGRLLESLGQ